MPKSQIISASITDGTITSSDIANSTITGSKVANSTLTTTNLATPNLGRRNLIINGDMAINQRGATSGVTSGYFVDRFRLSGCSASAVITSNTPTEFPTAITVSATSGNPIVTQRIESKNVQHLSGKVVTASFYAKNVSNATTLYASLQYAGSADNWGSSTTITEHNLGSLSSDWVRYTASWTVPSGGLNGLALNILCAGSSTFTMGVTGIQLEVGSQVTPFEHRSFGDEQNLCWRYYYKTNVGNHMLKTTSTGNSGDYYWYYYLPIPMRASPTCTVDGGSDNYNHTASPSIMVRGSLNMANINYSKTGTASNAYFTMDGITADAEL